MSDDLSPGPNPGRDDHVYDVLGIGFGPANMSLAVVLEEEAERPGGTDLSRVFLEAQPSQCWHPGMLLEGSLIQITVLKDLILVRNPQSRFTFLKYLQEKGRLYEFLNLRDLFPTRVEFNDYLCWVAGELAERIRHGRRVREVRPLDAGPGDPTEILEVVVDNALTGEEERYRTRNVVVATGGRPYVPESIRRLGQPTGRVFHSRNFREDLATAFPDRSASPRFVVVGSGQSGAEIFDYLMRKYPEADVTATVRGHGYKPVDESDFTNEVFFPENLDFFYDLPEDKREQVVSSFRDVNYAVVDHPLIRKIYRALYDERVAGRDRARLLRYLELKEVEEAGDRVIARFEHLISEELHEIECDGLVLCTGFRWDRNHPLLEPLADHFKLGGDGQYRVLRDYRLDNVDGLAAGVYLQGYCESTHGISETVLSLLPVRAGDIMDSILERRASGAGALVTAGGTE